MEHRIYEFDLPHGEALAIVLLGGKAVRRRRIRRSPEADPLAETQPDIDYVTVCGHPLPDAG